MTVFDSVYYMVIFQPLKVVATLRRIGYEPVLPSQYYSYISRQYFWYYPGIFEYTHALIGERGWLGLYRGLIVCVIDNVVYDVMVVLCQPLVNSLLNRIPEDRGRGVGLPIILQATKSFLFSAILHCLVEVVERPFDVIAVRAIAQHVGQETIYSSVLQAVRQIYNEEGIAGFYSGLVPALLQNVLNSITFVLFILVIKGLFPLAKQTKGDKDKPRDDASDLKRAFANFLSQLCWYSFLVVSNLMAINDSGLAAVRNRFNGWQDCLRHLRATGSLYRANVLVILFPRFARDYVP